MDVARDHHSIRVVLRCIRLVDCNKKKNVVLDLENNFIKGNLFSCKFRCTNHGNHYDPINLIRVPTCVSDLISQIAHSVSFLSGFKLSDTIAPIQFQNYAAIFLVHNFLLLLWSVYA